jgi:stearoyl-CoA desaturase (delta-9 desaturase)
MNKKICWPVFLFIIGYHLFLAIALPIYFMNHTPSLGLVLTSAALVFISGMAITSGYHRLYSHTCYKTHPVIEAILLFFGSVATQGSAIRWSHDHRLHHAYVDTDKDPYSVKKGLWYAHVLWMFFKTSQIDPKVIADLSRKKMLVSQHKYYVLWMLGSNLICFLAVGWMFSDYLGAFMFAWWVRLFFLHHTTWCINSLAHYWGSQNFSQEHTAVDNYLISLLTYGEGYHNYHHTFAYDYRNGIHWYHFDPAKWLIWTLYKLGLASDLKKVNDYRIARHLLLQHKNELLQKLKTPTYTQKVNEIVETISTKLTQMQAMIDTKQLHSLKKSLRQDWREWKRVLKTIQKNGFLESESLPPSTV